MGRSYSAPVPSGGTVIVPSSTAPGYAPAPGYPPGYPVPPGYYPPPGYPYPTMGAQAGCSGMSILRNLNLASLLDLAAQAIASFATLPAAPAATAAGAPTTQDLVTYQTALAGHAKRDEQIRFLGAAARTLLG